MIDFLFFSSKTEKVAEKAQLFQHANSLIYSLDMPLIAEAMQQWPEKEHFNWSFEDQTAQLYIESVQHKGNLSILNAHYKNQEMELELPFIDEASVENAIHCWAVLLHLGYPMQQIRQRMQLLRPLSMRLELKSGINRCSLINDSYNADLTGLEIALNFLETQQTHRSRSVILSDLLQSGLDDQALYRSIADLLISKGINRLFGIGKYIPAIQAFLPANYPAQFFQRTEDFLAQFDQLHFQDESILLKGARPFAFERIAERLELQSHESVLEIDFNALIHNLHLYQSTIEPSTKVMAMVKASAYGCGSVEVAKLLEFKQVDYLAVAYLDEGVELRQAGIQLPIVVLNPEAGRFEVFSRYQLEPEIYGLVQLQQVIDYGNAEIPFAIHLKFDTGMHRLGLMEEDLPMLIELLRANPWIEVKTIFSHLAASEASEHDAFSHEQAQRFLNFAQQLETQLGIRPLKHLLNSSGIIRFPQYQMDMVRLGIGLYGFDSSGLIQDKLAVVQSLKASISQIKTVPANATIGYSRLGKAQVDMRIAVINIGYADGFLRRAGNGRFQVLVRGQQAPTIGNVCMDMCMIDISHIPQATIGDEVIIFSKEWPIQQLAACYDTIPYEVLTGISDRIRRVYFQD